VGVACSEASNSSRRRVVVAPESPATSLRAALADVTHDNAVEVRGEAVSVARIQAALLGALAAIALLLCALGVYGLVAHSVEGRRREFSVRIALGATASDVLKTATAPGIILALCGIAVGLVFAAAVARVMQRLVFGVSLRDPLTFTVAASIVIMTACIAAFVPALRMLQVNVIAGLNNR
jgi:putative ABC transport system permease protein